MADDMADATENQPLGRRSQRRVRHAGTMGTACGNNGFGMREHWVRYAETSARRSQYMSFPKINTDIH